MFDAFWSDFKWKIFFTCFLPYLLYFSCAFLYIVLMLFLPDDESEEWAITADSLSYLATFEVPSRIILFILWLFHFIVQMKQIVADGLRQHF